MSNHEYCEWCGESINHVSKDECIRTLRRGLRELWAEYDQVRAELKRLRQSPCERCELIDRLRADECTSVEIVNDGPDFGGPNCRIVIWRAGANTTYRGDTVLECLRAALASQEHHK